MDAVAPCGCTDRHEQGAGSRRRGAHELSVRQQADAHGVDERVAAVAGREGRLAPDVRDADAVPVAGYARDDAFEDVPVPRVGEWTEAERVQQRDRPGAHGQDVADDAADAGRRPLVRLDSRRVVVRLHLEHDAEPVADVHGPGVLLPGLDAHGCAPGREQAQ